MAARTIGDLKRALFIQEGSYGVTGTGALSFAANVLEASGEGTDMDVDFVPGPGKQTFSWAVDQARKYRATLRCIAPSTSSSPAYNPSDFFSLYALGSVSGAADRLNSFSLLLQEGSDYQLLSGCKINELEIKSPGVGKAMEFNMKLVCQMIKPSTSKTFTGFQNVTMGSDPATVTTRPVAWTGISQININAGGLQAWQPKNWSLTVKRNLSPQPGNKVGADGVNYSLDAWQLNEGLRELIFRAELEAESETFTNAKLNRLPITSLVLPIDTKAWTLSNGVLPGNDLPKWQQKIFQESVTIQFPDVAIA